MKTRKILLTGFRPFGGYEYNPTQDLANKLNGARVGDALIMGMVLPATYWGAFDKIQHLIGDETYAIINMGFASRVQGIRFETKFKNTMWHEKYSDAEGFSPKSFPIYSSLPTEHTLSPATDVHKLVEVLLREEISAEISDNAHTFICNSLGYLVTSKIQAEKYSTKNIFLHIPWTTQYQLKVPQEEGKIFMKTNLVEQGLRLLIENI